MASSVFFIMDVKIDQIKQNLTNISRSPYNLNRNVRKPSMWILTRSDTNQAVQKMARDLKYLNSKKRAARVILRADFKNPSAEKFENLSWLPIHKRLKYTKKNN